MSLSGIKIPYWDEILEMAIKAQQVSGIGFLGAGAILRYGLNVKGLTTAANIWVIAAIGLVIGAGLYIAAAFGILIILFTLIGINKLEKKIFVRQFTKVIDIECDINISYNYIQKIISKHGKIINAELIKNKNSLKLNFMSQMNNKSVDSLLKDLEYENISSINIHEGN
jgi:putative Mg2+ transporter-C (MgtC) family protein